MLHFRYNNVAAATTILYLLGLLHLGVLHAAAYTPARPSNETGVLGNLPQDSIQINWLPSGQSAYIDALSQQLVNLDNPQNDGYRGALVRFTGVNATVSSDVPWIALVSCDADADTADMNNPSSLDVFSMAKSAGASTAILYSISGTTCALESNFVALFNGTMDVYVTTSRMSALAILRQFINVGPSQYWYDGNLLNSARSNIEYLVNLLGGPTVTATTPSLFGPTTGGGLSSSTAAAPSTTVTPNSGAFYLVATIFNSDNMEGTVTTQQSQSQGGRSGNTGLAMIILYAITGCVTILFLVVIISGAVRAIRHPERYGPRARNRNNPGDAGQSRAGGLTKAILDTFPVVKFLSGGDRNAEGAAADGQNTRAAGAGTPPLKDDDEEAAYPAPVATTTAAPPRAVEDVPMYRLSTDRNQNDEDAGEISHAQEPSQAATLVAGAATIKPSQHDRSATDATLADSAQDQAKASSATVSASDRGQVDTTDPTQVNDSITCPICLLDFEDGDDIRILPCDSRHRFHDACVVPWLLNVSSLCPLCRLDLAKEAPTSAVEEGDGSTTRPAAGQRRTSSATALASELRRIVLSPGRSSRASAAPSEAPLAESTSAEQDANTGNATQAPTSSRFLRYVQQRRNRVRAGSMSSPNQPNATRAETAEVPSSPNPNQA